MNVKKYVSREWLREVLFHSRLWVVHIIKRTLREGVDVFVDAKQSYQRMGSPRFATKMFFFLFVIFFLKTFYLIPHSNSPATLNKTSSQK